VKALKKKIGKKKKKQPKQTPEMPLKSPEEWSTSDVQQWLSYISTRRSKSKEKKRETPIVNFYEEYVQQFERHKIDGLRLLLQTRMTLANDLLVKNAHRPILMEFITELKDHSNSSTTPHSPRSATSEGPKPKRRPSLHTIATNGNPEERASAPASPVRSTTNSTASEIEPILLNDDKEKGSLLLERRQMEEERQKLTEEKKKIFRKSSTN